MMTEFWKMSGAGNDFLVFDNTGGELDSLLTEEFVRSVCRRGLSVGADGVLALYPGNGHSFGMGYWNSDGKQARMCGNGGRCICMFARLRGTVPDDGPFTFHSDAGIHRGQVNGPSQARIWMTDPVVHYLDREIDYGGSHRVSLVDTGVRHAVVFLRNDEDWSEFEQLAESMRHHDDFGPAGVNVSYATVTGPGTATMRTFEKGVEAETLACGTGAVAVAISAGELSPDSVVLPMNITVRSGQVLTVGQDDNGWWLQGEARVVYKGLLEAPLT